LTWPRQSGFSAARPANWAELTRPVKRPEPEYSDEARGALLQGTVVLRVVVGTDGLVHDAQVVRGIGLGLDENAIEAVNQWQFQPGSKDGRSVKVVATIEVNFRLF
jgi:protein TonB